MLPVIDPIFIEGFSVSDATLYDRATGLPAYRGDLYGIKDGEITADVTTWDDLSNDTVVNTWADVNFLDVKLSFSYLGLDSLSLMNDATLSRAGTGTTQDFEMELYPRSWAKTLPYPVRLTIASKDQYGNERTLYYLLYKVKFVEFDFMSPSYKEGMPIIYKGKALLSATNETGAALEAPSFGRLISTVV